MNEKLLEMKNIEPPTTIDEIVDWAIDLIDDNGVANSASDYNEVNFYVGDNDEYDGKIPTLSLRVPKEEVWDSYVWRAEMTFGNQDAALSSHVLIGKDGRVVVSGYDGRANQVLSEYQVSGLKDYLEAIEGSLVADNFAENDSQ